MIWPGRKSEVINTPTEGNAAKVAQQLRADRAFWDWCVAYMLNEDDTVDAAVAKAVGAADRLLEIRRERFPIED